MSKKKHLEILDSYAKGEIEQPKKELAEAYKDYKKLVSELNDADVDEEERLREVSFLEYEVGEIEEAGLTVGEDEELETQYKRFINGKKIVEALNQAYQYIPEGWIRHPELTGRALRELSGVSVYDEKIADMEETLTQIDNLLGDFNREIADYLDDTDFDEETFYHLEKRLDEINHLKSKYGSSIEEILIACREQKQERLLRLKDYDTYLADLKEKVKNAEKKLQKSCEKVSDIRKKYAEKLVIAVTEALKDLNFLDHLYLKCGLTCCQITQQTDTTMRVYDLDESGRAGTPAWKGGIRGRTFKNYACDKNSACRSGRGGDADL